MPIVPELRDRDTLLAYLGHGPGRRIWEIILRYAAPYARRATSDTEVDVLTIDEYIMLDGADVTVQLPAGVTHITGQVVIKDRDGDGTHTILPYSGETIDGAASLELISGTARPAVTLTFIEGDWSVT